MYQIVRIKQIKKSGINAIGGEEWRENGCRRSPNLDERRTHLNAALIEKSEKTLYRTWKKNVEDRKLKCPAKREAYVMDQAVITASPEFFEGMGWDREAAASWDQEKIPARIREFFNDVLTFMTSFVGKENLLSATVHYDETTPHIHIDYVPAIDGKHKRKDVYLKDENGKCIRNEKGHAIRARDENGKFIFEYVETEPMIQRSEFWRERGGDKFSYRLLQDKFNEEIGKKYGLERGERRPERKHIDQMKHTAEKLKEENAELERTNDAYLEHNEVLRNAAETYESLLKKPSSYVDISIKNAQLGIELDRKKKISKKKERHFERTLEAIKNYADKSDQSNLSEFVERNLKIAEDERNFKDNNRGDDREERERTR